MTTRIYSADGALLQTLPDTVPLHAGARDLHGTPLSMALPAARSPAADLPTADAINEPGDKTNERETAIVAAIVTLTHRAQPTDWTQEGLPRVAAIEKLTGFDITEAERDAAYATVNEED